MFRTTEGTSIANTADLRNRVQTEIDNHLAVVKGLQEKLALILQVESLANELGVKAEAQLPKPIVPELKQEQPSFSAPAIDQSIQLTEPVSKEAAGNGQKNPYASMQHGLQAYLGGKPDRALEFFKEARDLNPSGFEKTWTTMTAIPVYQCVGRDKYITEILFPK